MIAIPDELAEKHLREQICKGDVLFWKDYPGKEQNRDSHFIILTKCIGDEFLYIRATARVHLYQGPLAIRAQVDTLFLKKGSCKIFPKDTVLDFKWIGSFNIQQLRKLLGANLKTEGKLEKGIIEQIELVITKAKTISQKYKDLILNSN